MAPLGQSATRTTGSFQVKPLIESGCRLSGPLEDSQDPMSKSMVEKYEQMLAEDPTSTVFVELARAYLERGDHAAAIELCQTGCTHHPGSVVGRVLWGKALINAGKAAEAMQQFDAAVNIDRENPHAYNLIGEVLLRKGLYRSAMPILRKASALQPNDGRIKQWLEQARAALAGGPAPVLYDATSVDTQALTPATEVPTQPVSAPGATASASARPSSPRAARPAAGAAPVASADPDVFAAFAPAAPDPRSEPTVVMAAYPSTSAEPRPTLEVPTQTSPLPEARSSAPRGHGHKPGPPVPTLELPVVDAVVSPPDDFRPTMEIPQTFGSPRPSSDDLPPVMVSLDDRTSTVELPRAGSRPPVAEAPDPFASMLPRSESTETFRGLTSTFQALEDAEAGPLSVRGAPAPPVSDPSMPSVIPSGEQQLPVEAPGGGLLDDVVSAQSEMPTTDFQVPNVNASPRAEPAVKRPSFGGLLDEIPDAVQEGQSSVEAPRVEFSKQATEAIAKEYERELREKLAVKQQQKTFLQRHGLKLGLVVGLLVIVGGLAGSFVATRNRHGGENLEGTLARGLVQLNSDTREQYALAIASFEQALTMDEGNAEAFANIAFAKAVLYSEHGGAMADRDAARAAISRPTVREAHPDLALVVDFLTADASELPGQRQLLLGSTLDQSVIEAQAGRVLLGDQKREEAFKRLQKATTLNPRNLRALIGLGEYYLAEEDFESAARILGPSAEPLSRFHPQRVMGLAQARLELGREVTEALSELEGLPQNAAVPEAAMSRYVLLLGRAQAAAGKPDEAQKTLVGGLSSYPDSAFDFQMALGLAARNAGRMVDAQKAYEEALKVRPKSEDAKEGLGRVLLARSREKELLERVRPEGDQRKVSLVRGIAASKLDDTRRSRAELAKTQVNGKYPAEAVVYLALADATDEGGDKALQLLEKLVTTTRRNKATAQIALARVYLKRNELTKARAQLEEAAKDPQDYEANALLGQLYLEAVDMGVPQETALAPLTRAIERNASHGPSRHLLTRTYLSLGQFPEATRQVEAWTADNPASDEAWLSAAQVYLHTGRFTDAEAALAKAVKPDTNNLQAFRVKAQVLFALGDARNALASLERANKLNPKDAETFCDIGTAFVRQGNADTALKAYEAARRENPKALCGLVGPHHAKPTAKGARPTPKEELLALQKQAFAVWDRALVDASLARVLLEERDFKTALQLAEAATTTDPFSAPAWFALGEVARRQKNDARALEAYGKAATFDRSWAQARLANADALVRSGDDGPARALPEYEAVLGLSQSDADLARVKKVVIALKKQLK